MCPNLTSSANPEASTSPSNPSQTHSIPDFVSNSPVCQTAYTLASSLLHPSILNHSVRVYLLAKHVSDSSPLSPKPSLDLLFVASILHDIGTVPQFNGAERFEVCAADAAAAHLRSHGLSEPEIHDVWVAIALHTSPGLAERISPLARLVREGVIVDFGRKKLGEVVAGYQPELKERDERGGTVDADSHADAVTSFEREYPRFDIERALGEAVVRQALERREKAPKVSWAGVLLRGYDEDGGWEGVRRAF
jgi:hypothetical protein